jgi:hypothetical protein
LSDEYLIRKVEEKAGAAKLRSVAIGMPQVQIPSEAVGDQWVMVEENCMEGSLEDAREGG